MSEEIENALKCLEMDMLDNTQIELLLNYIDKLQKVIDLMADYTYEHDISTTGLYEWRDNEQIKEYFYKKAEE